MTNKIGVLVSGGGTNLQSIIDQIHLNSFDATISCVISNRPDAYALERAQQAAIPHYIIEHGNYRSRVDFEKALISVFAQHAVDLVCLAGFMRVLEPGFIAHYEGRILNIHPSLLPHLRGLHTHQRALDNHHKQHGCSVHFATAELDGGPLVLQAYETILVNDTAESLAARVLVKEHIIYPMCIKWLCDGTIYCKDEIAYHNGKPLAQPLRLDEISS